MNTLIMLALAVTFGVILGTIFTARTMSKIVEDRLVSRDRMWKQAIAAYRSDADRAMP